jgi:hypothetical protein
MDGVGMDGVGMDGVGMDRDGVWINAGDWKVREEHLPYFGRR